MGDDFTMGKFNSMDFNWIGSNENFIDKPNTIKLNSLVIGRYGGNSNAGQFTIEDGCLVWISEQEDWEFTLLLDAHNTSESAELIIKEVHMQQSLLEQILSLPTNHQTFKKLEQKILKMFMAEEFLSACRNIRGETACLIVVRKDKYVWWFSVGDCVFHLFHQELAAFGQYQINQRHFYEWIGQVNTFEQAVPCYSVGVKELRKGENRLFVSTDGLFECPNNPYPHPQDIYKSFHDCNDEEGVSSILSHLKKNNIRDSTTIITWKVSVSKKATVPSDQ